MHVSYLFSNLHMLQMIGTETQKHILIIVFSFFLLYIYMCVAAVTRAQRPDLFSGAHKNLLLAVPAHTVQCGCMAI
jgi:hypothetical protein